MRSEGLKRNGERGRKRVGEGAQQHRECERKKGVRNRGEDGVKTRGRKEFFEGIAGGWRGGGCGFGGWVGGVGCGAGACGGRF